MESSEFAARVGALMEAKRDGLGEQHAEFMFTTIQEAVDAMSTGDCQTGRAGLCWVPASIEDLRPIRGLVRNRGREKMNESQKEAVKALVTGIGAVVVAGVTYGPNAATLAALMLLSVLFMVSALFHKE